MFQYTSGLQVAGQIWWESESEASQLTGESHFWLFKAYVPSGRDSALNAAPLISNVSPQTSETK